MFLAGETAAAYHQTLRDQLRRSMTLATWLSRAAVTTSGRACALSAARLFPALMGSVAAATRIPSRSLISRHDDPLRPGLAPGD